MNKANRKNLVNPIDAALVPPLVTLTLSRVAQDVCGPGQFKYAMHGVLSHLVERRMLNVVWFGPRTMSVVTEAPLRQCAPAANGKNIEDRTTLREQERSRFDEVLILKMPQLYYTANRMMNNPADSEDALQEGLLAAFRHIDQFRGDSSLSTWLHSIVRNAARMQLRKKSRLRETAIPDDGGSTCDGRHKEFFVDPCLGPEEECARGEQSRLLAERMKNLSPCCWSAVQLCVIEGLLLREAAERLGVSTGTVKARLHRARKILGARL